VTLGFIPNAEISPSMRRPVGVNSKYVFLAS
jgi:hypothetical protein